MHEQRRSHGPNKQCRARRIEPQWVQRLLAGAQGDEEAVRDGLRAYVIEHPGRQAGCWS